MQPNLIPWMSATPVLATDMSVPATTGEDGGALFELMCAAKPVADAPVSVETDLAADADSDVDVDTTEVVEMAIKGDINDPKAQILAAMPQPLGETKPTESDAVAWPAWVEQPSDDPPDTQVAGPVAVPDPEDGASDTAPARAPLLAGETLGVAPPASDARVAAVASSPPSDAAETVTALAGQPDFGHIPTAEGVRMSTAPAPAPVPVPVPVPAATAAPTPIASQPQDIAVPPLRERIDRRGQAGSPAVSTVATNADAPSLNAGSAQDRTPVAPVGRDAAGPRSPADLGAEHVPEWPVRPKPLAASAQPVVVAGFGRPLPSPGIAPVTLGERAAVATAEDPGSMAVVARQPLTPVKPAVGATSDAGPATGQAGAGAAPPGSAAPIYPAHMAKPWPKVDVDAPPLPRQSGDAAPVAAKVAAGIAPPPAAQVILTVASVAPAMGLAAPAPHVPARPAGSWVAAEGRLAVDDIIPAAATAIPGTATDTATPEPAALAVQQVDPAPAPGRAVMPDAASAMARPAVSPQRQLADAIVSANDDRIEITLAPEELGRVKVVIARDDAVARLNIVVERPETLDLLRRHADLLTRELRDGGVTQSDINFASHDGRAQDGRAQDGRAQDGRGAGGQRGSGGQAPVDAAAQNDGRGGQPPGARAVGPMQMAGDRRIDIRI